MYVCRGTTALMAKNTVQQDIYREEKGLLSTRKEGSREKMLSHDLLKLIIGLEIMNSRGNLVYFYLILSSSEQKKTRIHRPTMKGMFVSTQR